jgi:hypothetical protein
MGDWSGGRDDEMVYVRWHVLQDLMDERPLVTPEGWFIRFVTKHIPISSTVDHEDENASNSENHRHGAAFTGHWH